MMHSMIGSRKAALFALVSSFAALSQAALDPSLDAPNASVVFYVHGHLNLVFASDATTAAYANYVAGSVESSFEYDVETRPVGGGDGEWTACAGALSKYTVYNETDFRDTSRFYWLGTSQFDSSVEVRARIRITKAGDAKYGEWSNWGDLGTADVLDEVSGTIKYSASSGSHLDKADDGDVNTYFEDAASDPSWVGLDAGGNALVSRIRFTHRNFNSTVRVRGKGAVFEAANAADFSDAVQLYTVPNDYDAFVVNDVQLETPVRARYFRVRTTKANCCNFTEVQWVGESACAAVVLGDGGESDYRARVAALGDKKKIATMRLLRGYGESGPFEGITAPIAAAEPLVVVDETSGVGLPCYYCWECTRSSGLILTGGVSSVYTRPRQLERDAADQTALGEGVALLPANVLFPDKTYSRDNTVGEAFDGNLETSPNSFYGNTNPVVGVSLPASAHLACVFVNADCRNTTRAPRMKKLALYGSESLASLSAGEYTQLADPITTYLYPDNDYQWFRYNSTDTNSLFACLFGYAPDNTASTLWCGHSREIRFVGWTEADEIASGKVFAPAGVSANSASGVVTVRWTAAVNATSLCIERRRQGDDAWTLVADGVDSLALSYVDTTRLRGGIVYEYRVTATGLGGLMSAVADLVSVEIQKPGCMLIVK